MSDVGSWLSFRAMMAILNRLKSDNIQEARERGARLGRELYRLDPKWAGIAQQQIDARLGLQNADDVILKNYEHYGKILAELACFSTFLKNTDQWFENEGAQHIDVIRDGGLVVSAHLGNWEIMGMHHTQHHQKVTALVKPIGNPYVEAWINQTRHAHDVSTVITRDNAINVRRVLKNKNVLVTLADQNSLYHEGVFVPFLGKPASTHYGPAMLAIRNNVPVITAFCTRTPEGKFKITYGPQVDYDSTGSLRDQTWSLTSAITQRVEDAVKAQPDQWFWVHKRWKNQPRPQDPDWKFGPEGKAWADK